MWMDTTGFIGIQLPALSDLVHIAVFIVAAEDEDHRDPTPVGSGICWWPGLYIHLTMRTPFGF